MHVRYTEDTAEIEVERVAVFTWVPKVILEPVGALGVSVVRAFFESAPIRCLILLILSKIHPVRWRERLVVDFAIRHVIPLEHSNVEARLDIILVPMGKVPAAISNPRRETMPPSPRD